MIISKSARQFKGYIEYSYGFDPTNRFIHDITSDDEDYMYESDTFNSLEELVEKMKPEAIEKIKEEYGADKAWISCISFKAKSEDKETSADISLYENNRVSGAVSTKIKNEDITDRVMLNMQKIKQIVDNTLEQYPIKY